MHFLHVVKREKENCVLAISFVNISRKFFPHICISKSKNLRINFPRNMYKMKLHNTNKKSFTKNNILIDLCSN